MVSGLASLGNDQNMGQISVEITALPGSSLSGNQQPAHWPFDSTVPPGKAGCAWSGSLVLRKLGGVRHWR